MDQRSIFRRCEYIRVHCTVLYRYTYSYTEVVQDERSQRSRAAADLRSFSRYIRICILERAGFLRTLDLLHSTVSVYQERSRAPSSALVAAPFVGFAYISEARRGAEAATRLSERASHSLKSCRPATPLSTALLCSAL